MQFQPGNPGGPGRPPKEKENAVLNKLRESVKPEQVVAIIMQLMNHGTSWRAQQAGIELYLHYMLGKPTQHVSASVGWTPEDWRNAFKQEDAQADSE